MSDLSHVTKALEDELAHPAEPHRRGEDMAFAVGTAVFFTTANMLLPLSGGLAAAAVIPELNRLRGACPSPIAKKTVKPHVEEAVRYTCAVRKLTPSSEATEAWNAWLPWSDLHAGKKVPVPAELPHPREAGFEFTRWASDVGQSSDWVRSMPDGSRLHAHEYPDGRVVVHRDELDPMQGPVTATFHWMSETPEGNMLAVLGVVGVLFATWQLVDAA